MILDDFIDIIRPDVIIWQFYFNDFINNYFDIDIREYPLNDHYYRPYLENGGIVYRWPSTTGKIRGHSMILDMFLNIYDRYQWEKKKSLLMRDFYNDLYGYQYWKRDFAGSKFWNGKFNETYNVTSEIMSMARKRAKTSGFYMISTDIKLQSYEEKIAMENDITYIPGIPNLVFEKEEKGAQLRATKDVHWNLAGNKAVGEFLVDYFNKTKTFEKRK